MGLFSFISKLTGIKESSLEDLGVLAGNYFLPGSSIITSQFVSPEAKRDLGSGLGMAAQLGTGYVGGGGLANAGIPASPYAGSLSNLFSGNTGSVPPPPDITSASAPSGIVPEMTGAEIPGSIAERTTFPSTALPPTDSLSQTVSQASNLPIPEAPNVNAPLVTPTASDWPQYSDASMAPPAAPATLPNVVSSGSSNDLYNTMTSGTPSLKATTGVGTTLANTTGGLGVNNPTEGFFAGLTPSSKEPFSLMNMGRQAWNWAQKNPVEAMHIGSGLYDMYAKNQMANAAMDRYNDVNSQIASSYAPGSPEYQMLAQAIARKDAAAGRNSQYGTRATELAARINAARTNALIQAAPQQNELLRTANTNRFSGLNSLFFNYAMNRAAKGNG